MVDTGDVFPQTSLPGAQNEQWRREAQKRIIRLEKRVSKVDTNLTGVSQGVNSAQSSAAANSQELAASNAEPVAPANFRATGNTGRWRKGGEAYTTVTVAWDAVNVATNGTPVNPSLYEVWATVGGQSSRVVASTSGTSVSFEASPTNPITAYVRASSDKGVWSGPSAFLEIVPAFPADVVPKAPVGLVAQKNTGSFAPDNSAIANIEIAWTPVTQTTANDPATVTQYEVWMGTASANGTPVGVVNSASFAVSAPSSTNIVFRVRAMSDIGAWGDLSAGLAVTAAQPAALNMVPTTPVLATGQGIVAVAWGGALTTGTPPPGFQHVVIDMALDPAGLWARVGTPLPRGGGGANVRGTAGQTVYFRLTAVDTLGRTGTPSAVASIVVKAVEVGDIDAAITDAINKAQTDATAAQGTASTAVTNAANAQAQADIAKANADAALKGSVNLIRTPPPAGGINGWFLQSDGTLQRTATSGGALPFTEIDVTPGQVIRATVSWSGNAVNNTFLSGITRYQDGAWLVDGNGLWITPVYTTAQGTYSLDYTVQANVTKLRLSGYSNAASAANPVRFLSWSFQNVTEVLAAQATATAAAAAAAAAQAAAGAAQTTANNAQTSANGKTKTYRSTLEPSGTGTAPEDTWEQWTSLALGGRLLAFWRWSGSAWVKGALDASYIPQIDIGQGTFGALVGYRLEANTVAADKLLVGDFTNHFNDPTFSTELGYGGWTKVGSSIEKNGTGAQHGTYTVSTDFSVLPGDRFQFTATRANVAGTTGVATIYVQRYNAAGGAAGPAAALSLPAAGTYTAEYLVPAGVFKLRLGFFTEATMPTATRVKISDLNIRRMVAGSLIVDGAITAAKLNATEVWANTAWIEQATINVLKAGVIQVDMLAPNVGDLLNIQANGMVQIIVGNQADQATQLSQTNDNLAAVSGVAGAATDAASNAKSAADAAAAAAAAAQGTATDAKSDIEAQRTVYQFTNSGARIQTPGGEQALVLSPDRISLEKSGVTLTYWEGNQMVVPQIVTPAANLGSHRWTSFGPGRSVIQPLST